MSNNFSQLEADNLNLKKRLEQLNQEVMQNETLLRQTQSRQSELLNAESLPDLLRILLVGLRDAYNLQALSLVYEDRDQSLPELLERHHLTLEDYPNLKVVQDLNSFSDLLNQSNAPFLGAYDNNNSEFFIAAAEGDKSHKESLKSVAIMPLVRQAKKVGFLSFGSSDPLRFTRELGTEFLQQLTTIIGFCIENVINRERLVLTGLTDVLTGWPNRRYLHQRMQEELARVQRKQSTISCIMFDLDNFKHINDTFGHPAGDEVLKTLSQRLRSTLRYGDIAARYGGEEFVLGLPDVKLPEAVQFAERIREIVQEKAVVIEDGRHIKVTISVGVACMQPRWSDKSMTYMMGELIAQADRHLYFAKSNGRNQVAY